MLYPQNNCIRETRSLDGIWKFRCDFNNEGQKQNWFAAPLSDSIEMPVPASYNDITQDIQIRDHFGEVFYETEFYVPASWNNKKLWLRFGAVAHWATVWLDGQEIGKNKGGFLPFEFDITQFASSGQKHRLTVAVDNRLDNTCLPPGFTKDRMGKTIQEIHFDFFNYSGIHRPVTLYCTENLYIENIWTHADFDGMNGLLDCNISISESNKKDLNVSLKILDEANHQVAEANITASKLEKIEIPNATPWNPGKAYLYKLQVSVTNHSEDKKKLSDFYEMEIGFRNIKVTDKQFLINDQPFYFKGFGKHEDMDVKGKGLDQALNVKDLNLLKWLNANSFRTSHYPYSEEIMQMADRQGIVVIDELPAVGMCFWNPHVKNQVFNDKTVNQQTLKHHLDVLEQLVARDRHHACVVMWSLANEAATWEENSRLYFEKVTQKARELDRSRPITIVQAGLPNEMSFWPGWPVTDTVADLADVICFNRYYGWYTDPGDLSVTEAQLSEEIESWYKRFKKPVFCAEYGADSIAGLHLDPPGMFSEEFQNEMLHAAHRAFDKFDFMIGEHVWNFADFNTKQGTTRIDGNKKGVFTRDRRPKSAAFVLKKRWSDINK